MADSIFSSETDWRQRSWILAALGASIGFALYLINDATLPDGSSLENWRVALSGFPVAAGAVFGFSLVRDQWRETAIFALVCGAVVGFACWFTGAGGTSYEWAIPRIFASGMAVAIAVPLFQAWRAAGRPRKAILSSLSYPNAHDNAWMTALLWGASWLFAGLTFLLGHLIGGLFGLIGIRFVTELMEEGAFVSLLLGGAFGGAIGMLRDREAILLTLQNVVRYILRVLAPVLGAGLVLFLFATLFTGLAPLWEATKATTPLLIGAAFVATILANAAIGDSPEDESKAGLLRWGSLALAASILPLTIIAAISTGLRINQHGLSPDRIWAAIIVGVACVLGAIYWIALLKGRGDWFGHVRWFNLRYAAGLCGLALLLSTPLFNFASWSTQNQVARLKAGKVEPKAFSWSALRYEYGPAGMAALRDLAANGPTDEIKAQAKRHWSIHPATAGPCRIRSGPLKKRRHLKNCSSFNPNPSRYQTD